MMWISKEMLQTGSSVPAAKSMRAWFRSRFQSSAEYQDVLNALAAYDMPAEALWLIGVVGPDPDAVVQVRGPLFGKHIFVGGRLCFHGPVKVSGVVCAAALIKANKSLEAEGGVMAGAHINVREVLKSAGQIVAGTDISVGDAIEAGQTVKAGGGIKCRGSVDVQDAIVAGGGLTLGWGRVRKDIKSAGDIEATYLQSIEGGISSGGSIRCTNDIEASRSIIAASDVDIGYLHSEALVAGGHLLCRGMISVDGAVRVRGDILAKSSIFTGEDVVSGGSIQSIRGVIESQHGAIRAQGSIEAAGAVIARGGIEAGGSVISRANIVSGEGIRAGGVLQCGPKFAVFAGLAVRVSEWEKKALISASCSSAKIISGVPRFSTENDLVS